MRAFRLLHVVGTRPNFMKVAPIMRAVDAHNAVLSRRIVFEQRLVHTGQHYSPEMSAVFFDDLGLPAPDEYLETGSGSQAVQTAKLMIALEDVLLAGVPDLLCVVGDVNSTLAAALVAAKMSIPIAHVESGLRSGDRAMPEEVNRILTDRLARLLFTTSKAASRQLELEGVPADWVFAVGNTMIDCLQECLPRALSAQSEAVGRWAPRKYAVLTLHRPSNVDDARQLNALAEVVMRIAEQVPIVFPVHARTAERLKASGALSRLRACASVHLGPPAGYLEFLALIAGARLVITDSGGVQAETCVLGTPCVTLRTSTEWSETVDAGLNVLANPYDPAEIEAAVLRTLRGPVPDGGTRPELWDGRAATRVVAAIAEWALTRATTCPGE